MWSRRSTTSTRRPSSRAQRSATVRPNSPAPATMRSVFTRALVGDGRRVARPTGSDEPRERRGVDPAGRRGAGPGGGRPVPAADTHVADVLPTRGEPATQELALQPQLGPEQ